MNAVDRYLQDVRFYLPRSGRDDIVQELSDELYSEIEEREAALGRPLDEREQQELVERHGEPMVVASRYRHSDRRLAFGRELIGPVLFPLYAWVLGITLSLTLVACLGTAVALNGPANLLSAIPATLGHLLIQFSMVTLAFVVGERSLNRTPAENAAAETRATSRFEWFADLVTDTAILVWLIAVWAYPQMVVNPTDGVLKLGPIWGQIFWPVVLLLVLGIVRAGVGLRWPDWENFRRQTGVVNSGAWLAVLCWSLVAGNWVVAGDATEVSAEVLDKIAMVNRYFFFWPLLCTTVVVAGSFVWTIRHLFVVTPPQPAVC